MKEVPKDIFFMCFFTSKYWAFTERAPKTKAEADYFGFFEGIGLQSDLHLL